MPDELDLLLASALKHARNLRKPTKPEIKQIHTLIQSTYANPDNWKPGRMISLVHKDKDGSTTLLGVFQEYLYIRSGSRKLCRCAEEPSEGCSVEVVSGEHWFGVPQAPVFEESPEEILLMKEMFEELLEEFPE
jgi:hypothetical protein